MDSSAGTAEQPLGNPSSATPPANPEPENAAHDRRVSGRVDSRPPPGPIASFNILNHLADPFDGGLDFDHRPGDFPVIGLGANRIGLAQHLLSQEF